MAKKENGKDAATLKHAIKEENFVIVLWNKRMFSSEIMYIEKNCALFDCMEDNKKFFEKAWKNRYLLWNTNSIYNIKPKFVHQVLSIIYSNISFKQKGNNKGN